MKLIALVATAFLLSACANPVDPSAPVLDVPTACVPTSVTDC